MSHGVVGRTANQKKTVLSFFVVVYEQSMKSGKWDKDICL